VDTINKIEWTALEYEEKERSKDWFWALGIIVVTAGAAAIIFGNYFFAALIVLSGVMLGFFAIKKPGTVAYELNDKGLKAGTRLFPYENIKSFWLQKEIRPTLFIKSERFFMPIIPIPIDDSMTEHVRDLFLSKNIPEEEMREHISDKIMEGLGF
jgi:hypothetical protein